MRLAALAVASALVVAGAEKPLVPREAMAAMEKSFGRRLVQQGTDASLDIVGEPRGIYLPGYGLVVSADVNLLSIPLSPFRPALTKEEVARLRQRKLARLPALRAAMRQQMVEAATGLSAVPADERIVVVVSLYNFSWEQSEGIPAQILMEATRKELLAFGPKTGDEAIAAKLKMQEFDNAAR